MKPPNVVLIHIPKTAGTSLRKELGKAGFRTPHTEFCYRQLFKTKAFTIMFSRAPRAHVLSQFLECGHTDWGNKVTKGTLFPRSGADEYQVGFTQWIDHFDALLMAPERQNSSPAAQSFRCYDPRNMQTRQISSKCHSTPHFYMALTEKDLEDAIANMHSVSFVGITELYALSWCVLMFKLTGDLPYECGIQDEHNDSHIHATHGVPRHDELQISQEVLDKVDGMTLFDQEFYRACFFRLMEDVQHVENATGSSLHHLLEWQNALRHSFYIENMWALNDGNKLA
jgi:hypothetical protein